MLFQPRTMAAKADVPMIPKVGGTGDVSVKETTDSYLKQYQNRFV